MVLPPQIEARQVPAENHDGDEVYAWLMADVAHTARTRKPTFANVVESRPWVTRNTPVQPKRVEQRHSGTLLIHDQAIANSANALADNALEMVLDREGDLVSTAAAMALVQEDIRAIEVLSRRGEDSTDYLRKVFLGRIDYWVKLAEEDVPVGQWLVGRCCELGLGVVCGAYLAAQWYRSAAEQGNAWAEYSLGLSYYFGRGVPQCFGKAMRWNRKAAEQGFANAQVRMGDWYYTGQGVREDHVEAARWYRLAAEQGHVYAMNSLGNCLYHGHGVGQDYHQAVAYYRTAAELGFTHAQRCLGSCYYYGRGISQDYSEAVTWYRRAADQGNADAQTCLGSCYYNGHGVAQDLDEAAKWYRKAADQGNVDAHANLAICQIPNHPSGDAALASV
jgi:TPR repeat protein